VIEKFDEDHGALNRFYTAYTSPNRSARFRQLYDEQLTLLAKLDFDTLNHDEQVDYLLFKSYLDHEQKELTRYEGQLREMDALIPFALTISNLVSLRLELRRATFKLRQVNAELEDLSLHDDLTGLYNRRGFSCTPNSS
jgi:hypothetical protein